jgi:ribonuclease P protein subunit POP4
LKCYKKYILQPRKSYAPFNSSKERIIMDEKTVAKDELIGLHVKVTDSKDPTWKGKFGLIVDETKNTFLIEINDQQKMIAKKTAKFEFDIDGIKIEINGSKIAYRPEDRIKKVR